MQRVFVGITGASGSVYAERLLRALIEAGIQVDLCLTPSAIKVLRHELGVTFREDSARADLRAWLGEVPDSLQIHDYDAIESPPSSGSAGIEAVVLCPCSMGTLARVAAGYSSNLVERAADVALKEGRALLLVPRETPLSEIHLENMLRLVRLGAMLVPAMPAFYQRPESIADLVDHFTLKVLDRLGVPHQISQRWKGTALPADELGTEGASRPLFPEQNSVSPTPSGQTRAGDAAPERTESEA
ncbi:MAG: 4-hydroxy-3-polyprenylbenzoate decarboxylase [Planctomycetota bacterium]|jgi:4-hydroxy-3-polyprenylbenzoate decarboxylase